MQASMCLKVWSISTIDIDAYFPPFDGALDPMLKFGIESLSGQNFF